MANGDETPPSSMELLLPSWKDYMTDKRIAGDV